MSAESLSSRTSESKRRLGRSVTVNGVSALSVDLKQRENLNDPLLDLSVKVNNPIGRLWLALKRLWKSQNTTITLKFTIPLIVLPIVLFFIYYLIQGKGVSTPISRIGIIHSTSVDNQPRDLLILSDSQVFLLDYAYNFGRDIIYEKPVVVIGNLSGDTTKITVSDIYPYELNDIPSGYYERSTQPSLLEQLQRVFNQFR